MWISVFYENLKHVNVSLSLSVFFYYENEVKTNWTMTENSENLKLFIEIKAERASQLTLLF